MNKDISRFENRNGWQATAKRRNGHSVAIMRGQAGGRFENKFYLCDDTWSFDPLLTDPPPDFADPLYSREEIKALFASGDLTLQKGVIPE